MNVPQELNRIRSLVECTPRAGLPNFFAKLERGGEVRIGYLGGSITAQPGWRVKSLNYFQQQHPQAKLVEIHAAIGGTGSDLGVLRLDHDVFKASPDLLFVEFAVNDAHIKPENIVACIEGIVRKTWKVFPLCDICFVYTLTDNAERIFDDLKAGRFNRSAAAMETVADHYQIASIHLGVEVVRLEQAGLLVMRAPQDWTEQTPATGIEGVTRARVSGDGKIHFAGDGVHPFVETGHQLYEEAIERSMPIIHHASRAGGAHQLAEPFDPANYENTIMRSLDELRRSGPWKKLAPDEALAQQFSNRMDSLWKAEPGAELGFRFRGSAASVYDILGPDGGRLEITVDGLVTTSNRIDGYCTYWRLARLNVCAGLAPDVIHDVTIRVLPDELDKGEILFEENRPDLKKDPTKYAGLAWYAGAVFIVGDGVEK